MTLADLTERYAKVKGIDHSFWQHHQEKIRLDAFRGEIDYHHVPVVGCVYQCGSFRPEIERRGWKLIAERPKFQPENLPLPFPTWYFLYERQ